MVCEECGNKFEQLYHCNCGKWVCSSCGWVEHGWRNVWLSICPTMLAPDKGQAAVVEDNLGSAPCG